MMQGTDTLLMVGSSFPYSVWTVATTGARRGYDESRAGQGPAGPFEAPPPNAGPRPAPVLANR
jgi:hypothetical protein